MIPAASHPADCGACDPEAPCADCALAYGLLDAADGEESESEEFTGESKED